MCMLRCVQEKNVREAHIFCQTDETQTDGTHAPRIVASSSTYVVCSPKVSKVLPKMSRFCGVAVLYVCAIYFVEGWKK